VRKPESTRGTFGNVPRKIQKMIACLAVAVLFSSLAGARPKDKTPAQKRDALADYVQRMLGTLPAAAATTPGSLWVDNGRLANLVADYSSAQVDQKKVGKLALAIQIAFQEMGVFPASTTQVPLDLNEPMPFSTVQSIQNVAHNTELGRIASSPENSLAAVSDETDLATLQSELQDALHNEIKLHKVALHRETDGLVISLREFGFFDSGSANIKSESLPALDRIASILSIRTCRLRIEGHTDDIPIHTVQMPSNWELSAARATELVRLLIMRHRFVPQRLSAAGYAEYHPIASNLTVQGRAQNRRVDIVILGAQAAKASSPDASASDAKPSPSAK
jgi:chemotaxis protein MotB